MNYLVKTKQEDLLYACLHSSCIRSLITFHEKTTYIPHYVTKREGLGPSNQYMFTLVPSQNIQHSYIWIYFISVFAIILLDFRTFSEIVFFFISFLGNLLPIRYCFFPNISMTIIEAVYIYPKIIIVIKANVDII